MRLSAWVAFVCLAIGFWAVGEEPKPPTFSEAQKKMTAGNFKDAFDDLRKLGLGRERWRCR